MPRLGTPLVLVAAALGIAWWQRDVTVPFVAEHVPAAMPYLAKVPGLVPAKPETAAAAQPATSGKGGRGAGGPVPVTLARAESKVLPVTIDAVGTVEASASIPIKPRLDSQIVSVDVEEGAKVTQGQPLFHLDDRATRAQLAQIEAQIVRDQAQIAQAGLDLKRAEDLLGRNAGSQVTRDTAQTAVAVAKAQLAADEAQRDAIQANLSFTVITASVSGRIGSIPVRAGTTVRSADATSLATVNQLDPANVSFSIPQDRLPALREAMGRGAVRVDVIEGKQTASGTVAFIENAVDQTTGTIAVTAKVPNAQEVLWPGTFVTARVVMPTNEPSIAVPTASLQLGQDGAFLFVVDPAGNGGDKAPKAQMRKVHVLRTAGDESVITGPVKADEQVVVDGQLRLVDGAPVSVKASAAVAQDKAGPVEASIGGNG